MVDAQGNKLPPNKGGLLVLRRPFPHMHQPLEERLELLEEKVLSKLDEPIRLLANLDASLPDLIESAKRPGGTAWWQSGGGEQYLGCKQHF
jgi:hypothetical protein